MARSASSLARLTAARCSSTIPFIFTEDLLITDEFAVDKVVGWVVRGRRSPLRGHLLLVSGRASFELTRKAWMDGVPPLTAVSAPSTLAA